MAQQKKKDSFVLQAGILAAAGIIVKIIGLIYRSPLTSIIGLEGNGYYSSAINIYTIILLVSSYSIPSAISKVIAQRLAYVLVVGGIASLLTFFAAPLLVSDMPNSIPVLRVFAPTIFFSGLLGVFRGYFQAHGSMVHTSISQILEQILNAVISILAAYLLIGMVRNESETTQAVYGASGSALGTGAGVLIALLFMAGMYYLNGDVIRKRVKRDHESYQEIFKVIITTVTPFILSTFIYNCSTVVNMKIYNNIMIDVKGLEESLAAIQYGIFATQAISIVNIPIALSSAMSSASLPGVSATFATHREKETRHKVSQATRMTMLLAIPSAVGLAVLAKPVVQFIYPQKEALDTASGLLRVLAVTVVLYSLSTLTNAVLQGIGKVNIPVVHAVIALVVQIGILIGLLYYTDWGLYALAAANIAYSFIMCLLNHASVKKYLGYREDIAKTYLLPGLASVWMGAVAYGVYTGVYYLIGLNRISVVLALGAAMFVYFVLIIRMGAVNAAELKAFPKGAMLVHIAKKMRLLK